MIRVSRGEREGRNLVEDIQDARSIILNRVHRLEIGNLETIRIVISYFSGARSHLSDLYLFERYL